MTNADDSDRPRGVLSPADRDYLKNPDEYSRQASHAREEKIGERAYNAILDFIILSEELDSSDRREYFDLDTGERLDMDYALPYVIAFVHNLIVDKYDNPRFQTQHEPYGHKSPFFEIRLSDALSQAYLEHDLLVEDVELTVKSEEVPALDEVRDRIESGRPLSTKTIEYLTRTGEIDESAVRELIADELGVDPPDFQLDPATSDDGDE